MSKTIHFVKIQGISYPVFFSNWAIVNLEKKFNLPLGKLTDKLLNVGEMATFEVLGFLEVALQDGAMRQGKDFTLDEYQLSQMFDSVSDLYKVFTQVFEIYAKDVMTPILEEAAKVKEQSEGPQGHDQGKKKESRKIRKSG